MAWSLVQQTGGGSSTNNPSISTTSNVTSGNLVALHCDTVGAATAPLGTPTVTVGGTGQTVTLIDSNANPLPASGAQGAVWYFIASATGACTVTFSTTALCAFTVVEFSGNASSSPVDQSANALNSTGSLSVGPTGALSNGSELVVAFWGEGVSGAVTYTPGTGYTGLTVNVSGAHQSWGEYATPSGTTAITATATGSVSTQYRGVVATFLPSTGASFVQGNQASGTTDGSHQTTISYATQNNAASNLLVASIATLDTVSVSGITDTAGNTWVKAISDVSQTGATKVSTWFVASCVASTGTTPTFNTLTITTGTASADIGVVIAEYNGAGTVVDVSGTGSGTTNTPSVVTSAATSANSELVISAIAAYANAGVSTGNTTTQTEEFPTTLDHYASGGTIASGETEAFDSTHDSSLHASSGSGSAQSKISGKTKGPTTGFIQQANTWANLFGIPSNATITAYSVSYDWSCTAATGPSGTPQLQLQTWHNGTAARNGTAVNGTAKTFTTATAWATATNDINVTGLSEAATQWATFAFQPTMSTSSSSVSNVVTVNYDHIVITVTYSLPASAVSFTAGTGWGLRENTSQTATFHGDAALEDEVLATAGTATATWTLANQGGWAAQVIAFGTGGASHSPTISDSQSTSETIARLLSLSRTPAETTTQTDTPSRTLTLSRILLEAQAVTETATRTLSLGRLLSAAQTAVDTAARVLGLTRSPGETVVQSDTPSVFKSRLLVLAETLTSSETLTRLLSLGRTGTDTTTQADTAARQLALSRLDADTGSQSDTPTRALSLSRLLSEVQVASETLARRLVLSRTGSDTTSQTDTLAALKTKILALAESATSSDALQRALTLSRLGTDTTATIDTASRLLGLSRTRSDSLAQTDAATRQLGLGRQSNDTANTADTAARQLSLSRTDTDTATLTDQAARTLSLTRIASEAQVLTDSVARRLTLLRVIADALSQADVITLSRNGVITIALSEAQTLADAVSRRLSLSRSTTDTQTAIDTETRGLGLLRTASEAQTQTDTPTRLLSLSRLAADAQSIAATVSRSLGITRTPSETTVQVDTLTRRLSIGRLISEAVTAITDTLTALHLLPISPASVGVSDSLLTTVSVTDSALTTVGTADALLTTVGCIDFLAA